MNKEKAEDIIKWLYEELERTSKEMKGARGGKAYTSEARCEGMADAILRIIKKFQSNKSY